MESWLRNVEMMDQWMDVRRQINTPSERRTELSDRMQRRANHLAAYPAKVSTHRCAPHPQKNCHNPMVSRTCRLPCSWTSDGSGQIRIWFVCFLSPWQVNKAGANGNKEVLSDFTPEHKTGSTLVFTGHFCQHHHRPPTWSTDYYNKINLSIQQKTDKGQSKYYHKSNNIGLSELCNQSLWWEENNGLCSVCKTMKTAVTICNISDHRVTTKPTGYKNMCYHCSNKQKLNG